MSLSISLMASHNLREELPCHRFAVYQDKMFLTRRDMEELSCARFAVYQDKMILTCRDMRHLPYIPGILVCVDGEWVERWLCLEPSALAAFEMPPLNCVSNLHGSCFFLGDYWGLVSYKYSWPFLRRQEVKKFKM